MVALPADHERAHHREAEGEDGGDTHGVAERALRVQGDRGGAEGGGDRERGAGPGEALHRSQTETWAGCIVSRTTVVSSPVSASSESWSRRRAPKASTVCWAS